MEKISRKSLRGTPAKEFRNFFFNPNMLTHISVDAVFDGDHEKHSRILSYCYLVGKKSKIKQKKWYFNDARYSFEPNTGTTCIFFRDFDKHILCSFSSSIESSRNYSRPKHLLVLFFLKTVKNCRKF